MSVFLLGSAIISATMIPAEALREGGEADGRSLAYLAHQDFGEWFGTAYDLSTIAILWFAGASAPVCREVLRKAEPDPERRPRIHVG